MEKDGEEDTRDGVGFVGEPVFFFHLLAPFSSLHNTLLLESSHAYGYVISWKRVVKMVNSGARRESRHR